MKVYELINELAKMRAGAVVKVNAFNIEEFAEIEDVYSDSDEMVEIKIENITPNMEEE